MTGLSRAATVALAARDQFSYAGTHNNTLSILGTPEAPSLPRYLTSNPLPQGTPWGTRTSWNTNYYDITPNTGVTRYYDWTISKIPCAPDGVETTCLTANGQVPGPTIEANWGDWIEVEVTNNITDEGTAIHWHGILQKGTPWEDGVPGFTQCPIAPGATFTYRFQADLYGTSWWHSHYSSQYGSGLSGPMVIYGPNQAAYDIDLGPVMASDWYHEYYQEIVDALLAPLPAVNIPMSDNNLINGKNSFDGNNAPLASFNFTSGKKIRIRFINPSAAAVQKITIDDHIFTVIANDFVEANGSSTDAVWMRAYKSPVCWPSNGGNIALAAIFYQDADRSIAPISTVGPDAYSDYCGNDPLSETVPIYAIDPGEPSVTEIIPLAFESNGTNLLWYMANRTFRADYNDPVLLEAKLGNFDFPYIRNVHEYGTNQSLRFIIENTGAQPHPMHVHGHNMFVLAEGTCTSTSNETDTGNSTVYRRALSRKRASSEYGSCWDGTITNPSNPQRRDVQMLLPGQFIVVQWNQDNPGVWPLHCHIAWHLSAGFVWTIIEQPDLIETDTQIPSIMAQTCRDWSAWTGDHVVDQIDDGL